MAVIETWLTQDLKKPVQVQSLCGNFFSHNGNANRIGVHVYDDGEPATLSGTVSGYAVLPDGTTVPCTGTLSGNEASVLLPAAAYVPGNICVTVMLTSGTTVTTLAALTGTVVMARTDTQVDPGSVVTDWTTTINAAMQEVETAAENMGGIVATPYTSLTYPVPLGKYTFYDNKLYRCVSPISSSETFTASHWKHVRLGDELDDVNNAIDANMYDYTSAYVPTVVKGKYIVQSDGHESTWAKACRTELFSGRDYRNAILIDNNAYQYYACYYNTDQARLSDGYGYIGHSDYVVGQMYIPREPVLIALTIKRVDGANMTDLDKTAIESALKFFRVTDTTLTRQNYAADAKTTGDAIAAEATARETAVNAEATARENADTAIRTAIDANMYDYTSAYSPNIYKGEYIAQSDGRKSTWNKACRTALFSGREYRNAILLDNTAYQYYASYYNTELARLEDGYGYIGHSDYVVGELYISREPVLIALTIKRVDDADMTDSDKTAIESALKFFRITDPTLTRSNYAADAKSTGEAISAEATARANAVSAEATARENSDAEIKTVIDAAMIPYAYSPNVVKGEYIVNSDGHKSTWAKACRTGLYSGYGVRSAILLNSNVYKFYISCYDREDATLDDGTGYVSSSDYAIGLQYIPKGAVLIALTIVRVDNADMSDSDVTAISSALSSLRITDKTLTYPNIAADAKTVGETVNDLNNSISAQYDNNQSEIYDLFEQGSLTGNNGVNVTPLRTDRLRTKGYISGVKSITAKNNFRFYVFGYDSNFDPVGILQADGTYKKSNQGGVFEYFQYVPLSMLTQPYYRLTVAKYESGSAISGTDIYPCEGANISINFTDALSNSSATITQNCVNVFLNRMNAKAQLIGMSNSHFGNVSGYYDSPNHDQDGLANSITARDMVRLGIACCGYDLMTRIWGKKSETITTKDAQHRQITLETTVQNTTYLDNYYYVFGGKTGHVYEVSNLLAVCEVDGKTVVGAVGKATGNNDTQRNNNRFRAMKQLMDIAKTIINGGTNSATVTYAEYACCALLPEHNTNMYEKYPLTSSSGNLFLYEQSADTVFYPCSVTKALTVITALDYINNPNEVITFIADDLIGGTGAVFQEYDQVSFVDAIFAAMLPSSNQGANVIARNAGLKMLADYKLAYLLDVNT